jgi:predicted ABC-type ATPase
VGYRIHVVFLWLPSAEAAVTRVRRRVRNGGHGVPAETVRRRYARGIRNFFDLYAPLGDSWRLYDNSGPIPYQLVAEGVLGGPPEIRDEEAWRQVLETLEAARQAEA